MFKRNRMQISLLCLSNTRLYFPILLAYDQILRDFNITYFILFDTYTSLILLHNTIMYTIYIYIGQ